MANIKVDASALRRSKKNIERKINELQALNSSLDHLLSSIEGTWEGKASQAYISTMRRHKQKADQMVKVLSEFARYIGQAADRFEEQDRAGASKIRSC